MGRRKATFTVVATAGQNGTKRTRRIDQSTELRLKGWCDIPRHEMGSGFHRRVHLCLRAGKPHGTRQVRSGQVKCGHTPGRSFAIARPILSDNLSRGGVNLNSTVTMTLLLPFFVVVLFSPRIAAATGPVSDGGLGVPAVPSGCDGLGLWVSLCRCLL